MAIAVMRKIGARRIRDDADTIISIKRFINRDVGLIGTVSRVNRCQFSNFSIDGFCYRCVKEVYNYV